MKMAENEKMRQFLQLDDPRDDRRARPTRTRTPKAPVVRNAGPHETRALRLAAGPVGPPSLTFARLHARGLFNELDEAVRNFAEALELEQQQALLGLLDEAPTDSGREFKLVVAFVQERAVAIAAYRQLRSTVGTIEVPLLVVDPELSNSQGAVGRAVAAYICMFAARRRLDNVVVDTRLTPTQAATIFSEHDPQLFLSLDADHTQSLFFEMMQGTSTDASARQCEYLQGAVRAAEAALQQAVGGGAGPSGVGGAGGSERQQRANVQVPPEVLAALPSVGEPIAIWVDNIEVSTVFKSMHFLAVRRQAPRRQIDNFASNESQQHREIPRSLQEGSAKWVVDYEWVGGADVGVQKEYDLSELRQVTPRLAADREMSLMCGYATGENGQLFDATQKCWCRLSFAVGGAGWDEHVAEEAQGPPQLRFSWCVDRLSLFLPTAELVVRRAVKHWRQSPRVGSADADAGGAFVDNPDDKRFVMVELFCGEAPLACGMRDQHGLKIFGLDKDPKKVWRSAGKAMCDGQNCSNCRTLHADELHECDVHRLPLDRNELLSFSGGRPPVNVHAGVECDTYSTLGIGHRNLSNNFMGDQPTEYRANRDLQHVVAAYYLYRKLYPHVVLSLENPGNEQGLHMHPLIRHLVEASVEDGGLGLYLLRLTYCMFGEDLPHKPTFWWTSSRQHYLDFVEHKPDGRLCARKQCVGKGGVNCGDFGCHLKSNRNHGARGVNGRHNTDTYPRQMVDFVSTTLKCEVSTRAKIELCPRRNECPHQCHENYLGIGDDGHFAHCSAVYDKTREEWSHCDLDGDSIICCGCPRLFHEGCLPLGHTCKRSFEDPTLFEFLCDLCAPVGWQALNNETRGRGYDDVTDDE